MRRWILPGAVALLVVVPAVLGAVTGHRAGSDGHLVPVAHPVAAGHVAASCLASRYDASAAVVGVAHDGAYATVFLAKVHPPLAAEVHLAFRANTWHCTLVRLP